MEIVVKRFEDLTLEELYGFLHCRQEVFVVEQNIIYQDLDYIDQHSTHMFIRHEGKIAAYLRIIDPGVKYKESSIGRVLTMPEFRHKGLSRKLMIQAIEEVKAKDQMPIKIEAQEYLRNFYESLGFKTLSAPFILEGISHIEMLLE
ncbi:MAG: GNAT family N-acetyltransferase [Muribaculaceae bacterium]|nr:GNAT family N-acetyltransferase [Muribaculaceae bacterium]